MRFDTAVTFLKKVSGGDYDPMRSKPANVVYKAVVDMANVTEQSADSQRATIGEIRPRTLILRLRERPGIRFDLIKVNGYDNSWKVIHELKVSKGYSVMVGESKDG